MFCQPWLMLLVPAVVGWPSDDVWQNASSEIVDIMIQDMAAAKGACGVSEVPRAGGSGWDAPVSLAPTRCGVQMLTNCSLSYSQLSCPEDCPFVAPHKHMPCSFRCVQAQDCYQGSLSFVFPNAKRRLCEHCSVASCKRCSSKDQCQDCFAGFSLEGEGGKCIYALDSGGISTKVMTVLISLIVLLVLTAFGYCACGSRSPNAEHNLNSIREGLIHRHLSKVQNWDPGNANFPRDFYNVLTNVHTRDVLGVGLGMFYNGICHIFVVLLMGFGVSFWLYSLPTHSIVVKELFNTGADEFTPTYPWELLSKMEYCAVMTPQKRMSELAVFSKSMFVALSVLYVAVFMQSLMHARSQKKYASFFDSVHADLADYTVKLVGLPSTATEEVQLKKWLDKELESICPPGTGVHGVSIAYNYHDKRDQVDNMISRLMRKTERDFETAFDPMCDSQLSDVHGESELEQDRRDVVSWFEKGEMHSTGSAFVVFTHSTAKDNVLSHWTTNPTFLKYSDAPFTPVLMENVLVEPPSILWENQNSTRAMISSKRWKALLKVFFIFLIVNALIMLPYNWWVIMVFARTGHFAGGSFQTIAGLLLGIVNAQIGGQVWSAGEGIGFKTHAEFDAFIFIVNTSFHLANTLINVLLNGAATGADLHSWAWSLLEPITESANVDTEHPLARQIYLMMVPGNLYTGFFMGYLMGNVVPYLQNMLLARIIYVWKCLPDCLLKVLKLILPWAPSDIDFYPRFNAEMALQSNRIGLEYDCAVWITNTTIGFLLMLCVSTYVRDLFRALLIWSVIYYFYCRFMHFRVSSMRYYTSTNLETWMMFYWGVPLSTLAAVAFVWGLRAGIVLPGEVWQVKLGVLMAVFASSLFLWLASYQWLVRPFEHKIAVEANQGITVDEVSLRKIYSWYNCNPVFALKCAYFYEEKHLDHPTTIPVKAVVEGAKRGPVCHYFQIGKQYLFFKKEHQNLIRKAPDNSLEFETWLEHGASQSETAVVLAMRDAKPAEYEQLLLGGNYSGDYTKPSSRGIHEDEP